MRDPMPAPIIEIRCSFCRAIFPLEACTRIKIPNSKDEKTRPFKLRADESMYLIKLRRQKRCKLCMQLLEERQLAIAQNTRIGTSLKVSSISRDRTKWGKGATKTI
jgi:hypothetical protein